VPLLKAAASVRKRVRLVRAYREAAPEDLAALGATIGVAEVFDRVVSPSL
jgi:hypothetical protein